MTLLQAVPLRPTPVPGGAFTFARNLARNGARWLLLAIGGVLLVVGFVLALLPMHLGLPLLVIGLIVVLRNSPKARRGFVRLQRRHPRFVFPIRRLIRREPEVVPVLWQQALRIERLILPKRWRRGGTLRRRYFRRKRAA